MSTRLRAVFNVGLPAGPAAEMQGKVWLDIETRKVPTGTRWPLPTRWQPFMVGLAYCAGNELVVEVREGGEEGLVKLIEKRLTRWGPEVRYSATREFDEMVLKGRFTNARRAHSDWPGDWPHVTGQYRWVNLRKVLLPVAFWRAADVESRLVPTYWADGEEDVVIIHCLRDVVALLLRDPGIELGTEATRLLAMLLEDTRQCEIMLAE